MVGYGKMHQKLFRFPGSKTKLEIIMDTYFGAEILLLCEIAMCVLGIYWVPAPSTDPRLT